MKRLKVALFATAVLLLAAFFTTGCDTTSVFKLGDIVPDFTMEDQYYTEVTLSEVLSEEGVNGAILAFYILDNSPG